MAERGGGGNLILPMLVASAGYAITSYGVVLLRGWNISLASWINPLKPYRWPADGSAPLCVPPGRVFPNGVGGVHCGGSSGGKKSKPFAGKGGPQGTPTHSASLPEGAVAGQHGR